MPVPGKPVPVPVPGEPVVHKVPVPVPHYIPVPGQTIHVPVPGVPVIHRVPVPVPVPVPKIVKVLVPNGSTKYIPVPVTKYVPVPADDGHVHIHYHISSEVTNKIHVAILHQDISLTTNTQWLEYIASNTNGLLQYLFVQLKKLNTYGSTSHFTYTLLMAIISTMQRLHLTPDAVLFQRYGRETPHLLTISQASGFGRIHHPSRFRPGYVLACS